MAIAFVQQNQALTNSSVTTQAVTFSSNTTSGNLIVVAIGTATSPGNAVSSITDSQTNNYHLAIRQPNGVTSMIEIWYAYNITGGTTPTVTATLASMRPAMSIAEYSGIGSAADPLDITLGVNGSAPNLSVGPTPQTSYTNELIFAAALTNDSTHSYTVGSGFAHLQQQVASTTGNQVMEDKIVAATGAQSATFTLASSVTGYSLAIATFSDLVGPVLSHMTGNIMKPFQITSNASILSAGVPSN